MAPWLGFPETLKRWEEEGYNDGDLEQIDFDAWNVCSDWFFPHPPFERQVVEEDGRHILYVNHEGIVVRELKSNPLSSMPQFVRFPVETSEDFRAFARERLQPDVGARIGDNWVEKLKLLRAQPAVLWVIADRWGGFFGPLRNLLGVEKLCTTFYTDPALIEEMMDTIADYLVAMTGEILDHVQIDMFGFWEDMAYNHGPLISPDLVRRHMSPRYRRVVDYLRGRGVEWISLDSDGRIDSLLPVWLEAGINLVYPFEVAAGMDVVAMRRRFGCGLRMYGGIDKRALAAGSSAIDAELERVRPVVEEGGYIPNVDHSVPANVSYANYRHYLERLRAMLGT